MIIEAMEELQKRTVCEMRLEKDPYMWAYLNGRLDCLETDIQLIKSLQD